VTPLQRSLYWREFQAAWLAHASTLQPFNPSTGPDLSTKIAKDKFRHELHIRALGRDKSSSSFTNADLDRVLAVFRAISQPANLNAQLRQQHQARTRLLKKIEHQQRLLKALGIANPVAYVSAILRDRFAGKQIIELSDQPSQRGHTQQKQFLYTLASRIDDMRQKKAWTVHQLYSTAGLPCPFTCKQCASARSADCQSVSQVANLQDAENTGLLVVGYFE